MASDANAKGTAWWVLDRADFDVTIAHVAMNFVQLIIPVFLLAPAGIPLSFTVGHLLPGFSLGFLVGSLGLAGLAVRLRRRDGRQDVTAHGFGNNVPAIIIYTLSIVLPVYLQTHDQNRAWQVGAAAVAWTGIIKLLAAPFAGVFRRFIPVSASMSVYGAAMYSYLAFVMLQRVFDQALVGIIALIILAIVVAGVPITRWRIPPFFAIWTFPLMVGLGIGYVRPAWQGMSLVLPFTGSFGALRALGLAVPYFSVIVPIAVYQILQDIACVEGGNAVGDNYDVRSVIAWDGIGTLVCGAAGSTIAPVVYGTLPPYKALGARISFGLWVPVFFLLLVMSGLTMFITNLFPWPILATMIVYLTIVTGLTALRRVEPRYRSALLLGFVLPTGAVVSATIHTALPALNLSVGNPQVQTALNSSIYWGSVQALANGFILLVLVLTSVITEMIDRNFGSAAIWCVAAAAFSWFGLMHSTLFQWGAQPMYAGGWLAAAAIVYSARWWRGDLDPAQEQKPVEVTAVQHSAE